MPSPSAAPTQKTLGCGPPGATNVYPPVAGTRAAHLRNSFRPGATPLCSRTTALPPRPYPPRPPHMCIHKGPRHPPGLVRCTPSLTELSPDQIETSLPARIRRFTPGIPVPPAHSQFRPDYSQYPYSQFRWLTAPTIHTCLPDRLEQAGIHVEVCGSET